MDPPANTKPTGAGGDNTPAAVQDAAQDQKRRSSSRSIKRKRFDDEIVEYSLGLPPAQVHRLSGRSRTQSQTYVHGATSGAASSASPTSTGGVQPTGSSDLTNIAASTSGNNNSATVARTGSPAAASSSLASSVMSPAVSSGTAQHSVSTSAVTIGSAASTYAVASTSAAATAAASKTTTTPLNAPSVSAAHQTNAKHHSTIKSENTAVAVVASAATVSAALSTVSLSDKRRAPKNSSAASASLAGSASFTNTNASNVSGSINHFGAMAANNKRTKKSRIGQQVSTKDLGRWKPIDDLALILGVQQTNDLRMVHRGIKFSCKFTVQELQSRWYSLMYEETISRLAVAAMRNLHPELVEAVQAKALYTTQEEELLGTIKSTETPTAETFQELLDKNALVFYSARTAKSLSTHWQLMKQYALLPDQQSQLLATAGAAGAAVTSSLVADDDSPGLSSGSAASGSRRSGAGGIGRSADGKLLTFAEAEEQMNDAELMAEHHDETVELELTLADRCNKKEIRMLENELTRWTVLVDSLTGVGFMPEFDNQTLAVLRGRLVRYLMRSREISFGRTTKDQAVDVDLSLEGPAHKASRRQGTIKLRSNGDFFIVNEGKRPLFIDGAPLLQGAKGRLSNNTIIEIAGLRFIFLINNDLINAIRQESAKMNGPLS